MSSLEIEILVVPRDGLAPALHASRAAVPAASFAEACALLGVEGTRWLRRSSAERDPSWKQVIPYVTLLDREGLALAYPRQGREARLRRLWSLGIGGHVERADALPALAWPAVLRASAAREVAEEYPARWHVFQANAGLLADADRALVSVARFVRATAGQDTGSRSTPASVG